MINKTLILIVGFRKCGTTTLYDLLVDSGIASGGEIKEPQILCSGHQVNEEFIARYLENFDPDADVLVDGSTYLISDPDVISKLEVFFKEVKVLVCIRNPVKRFFSSYWHSKSKPESEEYLDLNDLIERVERVSDIPFKSELEAISADPFYKSFYGVDYLRENRISSLDFKPKVRLLPFLYFSEGLYSYWLSNVDVSYQIVYFEEMVGADPKFISELSDYLKVSVDVFRSLPQSNIGYDRSGFLSKSLSGFKFKEYIPSVAKKYIKRFVYKDIPKPTLEQICRVESVYKNEIEYWLLKNPNINNYWRRK